MGEVFSESGDRDRNALLAGLPAAEWDRLKPLTQLVTLGARSTLHTRYQRLENAYFLLGGYVSLMIEFADGFQAETGQIGREGMVGVSLVQGATADTATATVQATGAALRVPAELFLRELPNLPALHLRTVRYAESLRGQAMQLAACNGHHGLDARLARCLLGIQDRYRVSALPITHEILATLLCAHRPSISVAAKRLQQAGLIRYAAGSLVIIDRPGLERAACECFGIMRDIAAGFAPTG